MELADELESLMRKYSNGKAERDLIEHYAELYACLKTLEKLERAYSRGQFSTPAAKLEYESECQSLLAQCRSNHSYIREVFPDISRFVDTYSMSCHRAVIRLQRGIPATLEHADGGVSPAGAGGITDSQRKSVRDVTEATEAIISLLDQLKLTTTQGPLEVDALTDPLNHTLNCLRNLIYLMPQLEGRDTLVKWSGKLSGMRAIDVLNEADQRQLILDTESLYREFKYKLNSQ